MEIFTKKNLVVEGEGKNYTLTWIRGSTLVSFDRDSAIQYLDKKSKAWVVAQSKG